jgi:hypothetical protein
MIARLSFAAIACLVLSSATVTGETNDRFDDLFGMEDVAPAVAPDSEKPSTPAAPESPDAPPNVVAPPKIVAPVAVPLPRARPDRPGTAQDLRNRNLCITAVAQATVEDEKGVAFPVTVCKVNSSSGVAEYQAWCSNEQSMIVTKAKMKMLKRVCTDRGGYAPPQIPTAAAPAPASSSEPGGAAAAAAKAAAGH